MRRAVTRGAFDFDPGRANVTLKLGDQDKWKEELKWEDNKRVEFQLDEQLQPGQHKVVIDLEPLTPPEEKKTSVDLRIDSVRIEGPLAKDQWVRPKNFERFFTQDAPAGADERRAYAREILSRFTKRAFRRPVDERTIDKLVAIAEEAYGEPNRTFEYGLGRAMVAVLAPCANTDAGIKLRTTTRHARRPRRAKTTRSLLSGGARGGQLLRSRPRGL